MAVRKTTGQAFIACLLATVPILKIWFPVTGVTTTFAKTVDAF